MGVFRQLGDPLAAAECLCQHHGAAYAEDVGTIPTEPITPLQELVQDATTLVSVPIMITERCCIVVNAATMAPGGIPTTALEIERPFGTIRTTQEDVVLSNNVELLHHAAWEVVDPGVYTYFLVNRFGSPLPHYGCWIKAIASDCEG